MRAERTPGLRVAALLLAAGFLLLRAAPCAAQETAKENAQETPALASIAAGESAAPTPIPLTYTAAAKSTNADAAAKAKRAAIIGVGAFPFALFYTNFVFDAVRFAVNGFDAQYAPWPFKNQYSAEVSVSETFIRLGVSAGVSAIVGLLGTLLPGK